MDVPKGLEVGDLLLFCPANPRTYQEVIVVAQQTIVSHLMRARRSTAIPADACFTHVGVYVGNGTVFDTTRETDSSQRRFHEVAADGCYVRARRLKTMTAPMRARILANVPAFQGPYSVSAAVFDGLLSAAPDPWDKAIHHLVKKTPWAFVPARRSTAADWSTVSTLQAATSRSSALTFSRRCRGRSRPTRSSKKSRSTGRHARRR